MLGKYMLASRLLASLVVLIFCASGCTPRQIGASQQGFYGSGLADFDISVAPPLPLAATGKLTVRVPSDSSPGPTGNLAFSLFAEGEEGQVQRHAHILFSELPRASWQWEKETWAKQESLLYTTQQASGKNWTIQVFPVIADRDWFSALWLQNGRQVPDFWLAKRWSATPEEDMRLVAEYREPAPACMRDQLVATTTGGKNAPPLKGKELRPPCEQELESFMPRADAVFTMERLNRKTPELPVIRAVALPDRAPDMGRLAGRAEARERLREPSQ